EVRHQMAVCALISEYQNGNIHPDPAAGPHLDLNVVVGDFPVEQCTVDQAARLGTNLGAERAAALKPCRAWSIEDLGSGATEDFFRGPVPGANQPLIIHG